MNNSLFRPPAQFPFWLFGDVSASVPPHSIDSKLLAGADFSGFFGIGSRLHCAPAPSPQALEDTHMTHYRNRVSHLAGYTRAMWIHGTNTYVNTLHVVSRQLYCIPCLKDKVRIL